MIAARASTPEYTVIGQVGETGLQPVADDGKPCKSDATFSTDAHAHVSTRLRPILPRNFQRFCKQQGMLRVGKNEHSTDVCRCFSASVRLRGNSNRWPMMEAVNAAGEMRRCWSRLWSPFGGRYELMCIRKHRCCREFVPTLCRCTCSLCTVSKRAGRHGQPLQG
jgi:hypothetical protein